MRRTIPSLLVVLPVFAACGGAGPAAPPGLFYDVPREPSAVYLHGDTTRIEVEAGGQVFQVTRAIGATLGVDFAPNAGGGTEVTATFQDFSARATNPMSAPETASGSDVSGALVFTLDRRGKAALVREPELRGMAAVFLPPAVTISMLFPRLPGRAVAVGQSWTDTVNIDTDDAGQAARGTSIVTYTVAGDTLVANRSLLRVTATGKDERHIEGSQGGMDLTQDVTGDSEGYFLWDIGGGRLYEWVYATDYSGTMSVSAAPFPLSVNLRSTAILRLRDGM